MTKFLCYGEDDALLGSLEVVEFGTTAARAAGILSADEVDRLAREAVKRICRNNGYDLLEVIAPTSLRVKRLPRELRLAVHMAEFWPAVLGTVREKLIPTNPPAWLTGPAGAPDDLVLWIASCGHDKLVGWAARCGDVAGTWVDPGWRRRGVGTTLVLLRDAELAFPPSSKVAF